MTALRTEGRTRAAKVAVIARALEGMAQGLDRATVHGWACDHYGRTLSWREITDLLRDARRAARLCGIDCANIDPSWSS